MPISKRAAGGYCDALSETTGAFEGAADAGSDDGMTECKVVGSASRVCAFVGHKSMQQVNM